QDRVMPDALDPTPYDALLLLSFGGPEGPDDVATTIATAQASAIATIVCPTMTRRLDAIAAIAGIAESRVTMPRAASGSVTRYADTAIPTIPIKPTTENIRSDNRPTASVRRKIANVLAQIPTRYGPAPARRSAGDNSAITGRGRAPPVLKSTANDRASVRARNLAYLAYSPCGLTPPTIAEKP
ncbi:hypothetical protein ABZ589_38205, partial [Streptomyces sp. NPDC013313]|uniref:hypothetical protein n=1 Tax=Streptomyces sp. NPDC013313 TaxID=3155603 RepID=UPI0033CC7D01